MQKNRMIALFLPLAMACSKKMEEVPTAEKTAKDLARKTTAVRVTRAKVCKVDNNNLELRFSWEPPMVLIQRYETSVGLSGGSPITTIQNYNTRDQIIRLPTSIYQPGRVIDIFVNTVENGELSNSLKAFKVPIVDLSSSVFNCYGTSRKWYYEFDFNNPTGKEIAYQFGPTSYSWSSLSVYNCNACNNLQVPAPTQVFGDFESLDFRIKRTGEGGDWLTKIQVPVRGMWDTY